MSQLNRLQRQGMLGLAFREGHMRDDLRKRLHEVLISFAIGRLNPTQCAILGGVIATLQAIDNDVAAITWLVESGSRILDELRQAGDS